MHILAAVEALRCLDVVVLLYQSARDERHADVGGSEKPCVGDALKKIVTGAVLNAILSAVLNVVLGTIMNTVCRNGFRLSPICA